MAPIESIATARDEFKSLIERLISIEFIRSIQIESSKTLA